MVVYINFFKLSKMKRTSNMRQTMIIHRLLRPYGIFPVVNDQGERRYIQVEPFLWATGTKFAFYYTYALPPMAQELRTCKNERAYWVGGSRLCLQRKSFILNRTSSRNTKENALISTQKSCP